MRYNNQDLGVIEMPEVFQKLLFKIEERDVFIAKTFKSHPDQLEIFKENIEQIAKEISDDYEGAEWVLAKEDRGNDGTFFLFPQSEKKAYNVKLPRLNDDCDDDCDEDALVSLDPSLTYLVDEKVFGLITLLAVFDNGMYTDWIDEEVSYFYMDIGQNLNESVVEATEHLNASKSTAPADLLNVNKMMSLVVEKYLRTRPDDISDY